MVRDIEFFHEECLARNSKPIKLLDFAKTLPYHLCEMFDDSMGGVLSLHNINPSSILKGYQGPYCNGASGDSVYLGPKNGLQEVRYRWGIPKCPSLSLGLLGLFTPTVFFLCSKTKLIKEVTRELKTLTLTIIGFGALGYAIGKLYSTQCDRQWYSLYFDNLTGECLSYDKNIAGKRLLEKGDRFFQERELYNAALYYANALTNVSCSYDRQIIIYNIKTTEAEIEAVRLNSQGNKLFNQEKYMEAQIKYQEAYYISKHFKRSDYEANFKRAKMELEALKFNALGDEFFKVRKYSEAQINYEEARYLTSIVWKRFHFEENLSKVKVELEAMNLNSQGVLLYHQGKYIEAQTKFNEAISMSQVRESFYADNLVRTQVEIKAANMNDQGNKLFELGKYRAAQKKFTKAYNISQVSMLDYEVNIKRAKVEIKARNFNYRGETLFQQGKYSEAQSKFRKAYNISQVKKSDYEVNIIRAQMEIEALILNSAGEELFKLGKYIEAQSKFQEAYNTSQVGKLYCEDNIKRALGEIEARKLNSQGDELFEQGKYCEAKSKYEEAYVKSHVREQDCKYRVTIFQVTQNGTLRCIGFWEG